MDDRNTDPENEPKCACCGRSYRPDRDAHDGPPKPDNLCRDCGIVRVALTCATLAGGTPAKQAVKAADIALTDIVMAPFVKSPR